MCTVKLGYLEILSITTLFRPAYIAQFVFTETASLSLRGLDLLTDELAVLRNLVGKLVHSVITHDVQNLDARLHILA